LLGFGGINITAAIIVALLYATSAFNVRFFVCVCRSFRSMNEPLYFASEDCYLEAPKGQVRHCIGLLCC